MSFLQPKIIPRGYIATTNNKTIPRKRLNSISEISLQPALPNLPRPYVKRARIDPFEQHYVTPLLRMFDEEEEAENEKNKLISDEQKSKLKEVLNDVHNSSIANSIRDSVKRTFLQPIDTLYDLVTLPADLVHALERTTNTDNDTARLLKAEEKDESIIGQNEKDKKIKQTIDDISRYINIFGGIPKRTIRRLNALKNEYFDDDVDVSSDLQAWNKEEENEEKDHTARELQGLITSKFQQKGYKERMDATKSLQSLLRARKEQKERDPLSQAQGLIKYANTYRKSKFIVSKIFQDVRNFLKENPEPKPEEITPEMHEKLLLYTKYRPCFPNVQPLVYRGEESYQDGFYKYYPETKRLRIMYGTTLENTIPFEYQYYI